jgi:Ca-activated chloride channel homolog
MLRRLASFAATCVSILVVVLVVSQFKEQGSVSPNTATATVSPALNAVYISVIYAPEAERYMSQAITDFNQAYANGINPLSGRALQTGERPIHVTGRAGSSGIVMQGIVNAIIAPNNANVETPTVFIPAVSHWLVLGNYRAGVQLFDLHNEPTALSAIVIAIWQSKYDALSRAYPGEALGWKHLLEVMQKGWNAYGIADRDAVYYGHTDPYISSTGLSTLIMEFYASARYNAQQTTRRLTVTNVRDSAVQGGVHAIHAAIKHYSRRTTEFKNYIAQGGSEYIDFTTLPENEFLQITEGKAGAPPIEPLIAMYPSEGTFWHDYPFAIVNASWVSAEQRAAAIVFRNYVLSETVQQLVLAGGFRPVNPNIPLTYPYVAELGVDPMQPQTVLDIPDAHVIAEIQQSWSYVKKEADIWLLIDTSGSMAGEKMDQARRAALAFLDNVEQRTRVGLATFDDEIRVLVEIDSLERNRDVLHQQINNLHPKGGTALYASILHILDLLKDEPNNRHIQAIVVLSDGQDTSGTTTLQEVTQRISTDSPSGEAVLVIPVAYGSDADISALNALANASKTRVQPGDPENITSVLEVISGYF